MLRIDSLAFRLVAIAAGWSLLGLIAGGFLLSSLFRSSIERSLDNRLVADLENVISVAEMDCRGSFVMAKPLIAERFNRVFSGSYWQVRPAGAGTSATTQPVMRSRSLWDKVIPPAPPNGAGAIMAGYAPGPLGQRLRYVERVVSLPGPEAADGTEACVASGRFRITVAGDMRDVESEVQSFNAILLWSVIALGAGLVGAMALFVKLGLAPLGVVSRSLAAIREGRATRLEGRFPLELQPLADELNALVQHNADVVARARTHVANLAHFLKTPLSVLANEVQGATGPMAETVARQVQVMRRQVDHYLTRARTVGSASVLGARCEVAPVASDLVRALSKIYDAQGIAITRTCPEGLFFRGDRADLEEMIGNLIDNACKWAAGDVSVTAAPLAPARLRISVADDGPGLSEEQKKRVLERGERMDESKPGSGLGLGIVREIAALYGGTLSLERSEAGGLLAVLDLPAIERTAQGA